MIQLTPDEEAEFDKITAGWSRIYHLWFAITAFFMAIRLFFAKTGTSLKVGNRALQILGVAYSRTVKKPMHVYVRL